MVNNDQYELRRLKVPLTPQVYQPTNPLAISVTDTGATGAKWYLYVSATPLTSTTVSDGR
ncbi:hypothetical protein [Lactiplantibacillus plantarum]|uniref:hypothetical protein n=1 Tax=Lactiplantibacillus plantarum TaxID=1590 RepID=UPI0004886039|nr:hypothetical protein [Lactiplantibacillus plantarum]